MPLIPYGFETHHMDFTGTIDVRIEHLLNFVLDITKSVAHHGFDRILIADGHGSNMPILELVARRTILETEALCGAFIWPSLALKEIREVRESGRGGMAHAGELETSVYLHIASEKVQFDKAKKDINLPNSEFMWLDLTDGAPIHLMDHWTRFSKTGVHGDPTLATPEKGKLIFEAVVNAFLRLVKGVQRSAARGAHRLPQGDPASLIQSIPGASKRVRRAAHGARTKSRADRNSLDDHRNLRFHCDAPET